MKITDLVAIPLESPVGSVQLRAGVQDQTVAVLPVVVKMHTDAGITGLGETLTYDPSGTAAIATAQAVESLGRHLVGKNPLEVTRRWRELYQFAKRSGGFKALSALDEALWDIAAKDAGKPLFELLGGRTSRVRAYATFPHRQSAGDLVEKAERLAGAGFPSMKITVGRGVTEDREYVRAVSGALPEGFGLAVDANTSYDFADALRLGRTADELELDWIEEPIPHTDIAGQAELNRRLDVPIAAYQSHFSHYPVMDHLRANALEIYQPALYLCGGVSAAHRVATVVETFGKRFVPHAFGPLINYSASLHVCVASPVCDLIEFAIYDGDDMDDPGRYVASPYVANQDDFSLDDDGSVSPPDAPGLGIELDESVIEELRLD